MVRGKQAKREGQKMKKKEDKIQEAVIGLKTKKYKNVQAAAEDLGVPEQAATIRWRWKGTSKSRIESQSQFQLLSPVKEDVLVQWIKFYGFAGLPLSKKVLHAKVKELCGRVPGNHCFDHFLRRHPDCTPGQHSGLDLKRAVAFNPTTVKAHFDLLRTEFDNGGKPIPARNIYNMDEVGIQLGLRVRVRVHQSLMASLKISSFAPASLELHFLLLHNRVDRPPVWKYRRLQDEWSESSKRVPGELQKFVHGLQLRTLNQGQQGPYSKGTMVQRRHQPRQRIFWSGHLQHTHKHINRPPILGPTVSQPSKIRTFAKKKVSIGCELNVAFYPPNCALLQGKYEICTLRKKGDIKMGNGKIKKLKGDIL
ncbi:hypothetical protein B0H13DRAFT_80936 [Mycena leptocephala]|nr:hypothetical protein B0H13DRAFT_80936 [Mycena leptocephala]